MLKNILYVLYLMNIFLSIFWSTYLLISLYSRINVYWQIQYIRGIIVYIPTKKNNKGLGLYETEYQK